MKFDVKEFKENAKKVMEEQIKNNELSFSELVAKSDALVEELTDVEKRRAELIHELINVQGMSLYDIQNQLCSQMMKKGKKKDYIQYKAHNGLNNKQYKITVCVEEIE